MTAREIGRLHRPCAASASATALLRVLFDVYVYLYATDRCRMQVVAVVTMVRGREQMNRTEVIDCATGVVTKLDVSSCVSTSSGRVFGMFNVYGVVLGNGRYGGADGGFDGWVEDGLVLECQMSHVSG